MVSATSSTDAEGLEPLRSTTAVGDAKITNSLIWGNGADNENLVTWTTADVTYSNVQGGADGVGNMDVNPRLAVDGYHLKPNSPLIDAGSPQGSVAGLTDIDGQPRLLNARTDIGADEVRLTRLSAQMSDVQAQP